MTDRILIVEDEPRLAELLRDYLKAAGYDCDLLLEGSDAVSWIRDHSPSLVLLDLMLPGKDGLAICREVRAFSAVPIIMTTARVEEIDRLIGLELGADDYVCKPYSPREVVARVKAVLRRGALRATQHNGAPRTGQDAQQGPLRLEQDSLRVYAEGRETELTAVEFALLQTLYRAPGRILSRNQLMDRIYHDHRVVSDRTIDSHVKKLRRKLAELLPEHDLIHSVYGVGYRYEERQPEADQPDAAVRPR